MLELIYETHATTVDNEEGRATGWLPGELSAAGLEQARALGRRRRDDGLDAVFSSDLARAVETAQIAFDHDQDDPGRGQRVQRSSDLVGLAANEPLHRDHGGLAGPLVDLACDP